MSDGANREEIADEGGEGDEREEAGGFWRGLTKPRQVCSQGLRLWKTNLETSLKISIKDTKLRGPKGPIEERRPEPGISEAQPLLVKSKQPE
jgi:hypothetical protein